MSLPFFGVTMRMLREAPLAPRPRARELAGLSAPAGWFVWSSLFVRSFL